MMYINNILAIMSSHNNVLYVVIVILVLMSLLIFSLIYSQNREINETIKRKQNNKNNENSQNEPFNIYQDTKTIEDSRDKEEVLNINQEEVIPFKEEISKELEEPELVQLTDLEIPDKLEYTQALWQKDEFDLESISKEIETSQKDLKINMTPFEAEQEEKAIISYDELLNRAIKDGYKTNDLDTSSISLNEKVSDFSMLNNDEKEIVSNSYEHEESFLKDLKELKDSLI